MYLLEADSSECPLVQQNAEQDMAGRHVANPY